MDKALDDKLVADFPKIFRDRNKTADLTCMAWGFECGDGWYNLIHDLCETIQNRIDSSSIHFPQIIAGQVKEKFGSLRFYYSLDYGKLTEEEKDEVGYYHENEIEGMISFAEHLSAHICETCGARGEIRYKQGWYYCACEKHSKTSYSNCSYKR